MKINFRARLAFPKLAKPESFMGNSDLKYSASFIVEPDSASDKRIEETIIKVAKEKWGKDAEKIVSQLKRGNKISYIDGDTKAEVMGFEGNKVMSASTKAEYPPALVRTLNGQNVRIDRDSEDVNLFYGGCYVNAIVDCWAQDNQYGKRINFSLAGVQFYADGDAFASGGVQADDFEIVEEPESIPDFTYDDEEATSLI